MLVISRYTYQTQYVEKLDIERQIRGHIKATIGNNLHAFSVQMISADVGFAVICADENGTKTKRIWQVGVTTKQNPSNLTSFQVTLYFNNGQSYSPMFHQLPAEIVEASEKFEADKDETKSLLTGRKNTIAAVEYASTLPVGTLLYTGDESIDTLVAPFAVIEKNSKVRYLFPQDGGHRTNQITQALLSYRVVEPENIPVVLPSDKHIALAGFAFAIKDEKVWLLGRIAKAKEAKAITAKKNAQEQAQAERLLTAYSEVNNLFSSSDWLE